ncbi:type III secretion system inner membrane ring lipoprotein SctJ [Jannaschia sp. LMIT008]|uniref:type III secretion system inner membrane ring lipoprotein SctJ n=1 Tax=Jannaschia maritima TaxID=3032585 RepID=UPI002811FA0A|nr:type III secretion inner membrane ring lipoprotein SctJ [Jannaschia sp. LMIT008]
MLALMLLGGCRQELYGALDEQEANEIVAVLSQASIDVERRSTGDAISVLVDRTDFARAVALLRTRGLPKERYDTLGDVFGGGGFVPSQMEQRARFVFAMSQELSRTLSEIDDVVSARVHIVLPTSDPLSRRATPSSASVVIRHVADAPVARLMSQMKMVVANSIEGLRYENVSVVFLPVAAVSEDRTPDRPAEASAEPPAAYTLVAVLGFLPILALGGHSLVSLARRKGSDIRITAPQ